MSMRYSSSRSISENITEISVSSGSRAYVRQWLVPSRSRNKSHKVSETVNGTYECSCEAWIYGRKECYHIQRVKNEITEARSPRRSFERERRTLPTPRSIVTPMEPAKAPKRLSRIEALERALEEEKRLRRR